ncbi:MAG: Gfo/Idh/MocA family oxidoreductase [Bacteroidales bacterium]
MKKNDDPVKVLIVAVNGYGHYYLRTLLKDIDCSKAMLAGVVDPAAEKSEYHRFFIDSGIPVADRISDFYLGGGKADLAVISSPPQYHIAQSMTALHNGTNVLCEKPLSGCLADVPGLIAKSSGTGRFVMVGFQWSYSDGIQRLKHDILDGRFGKPLRMKSLCLWPRDLAYFKRNSWAYTKVDPDGHMVNDNIFNNATSHFIHNMFYLLGEEPERSASATPGEVLLARANDVETYDTGAFTAVTNSGAELLFLASHATEKRVDPCFRIEFEKGFAELKPGAATITVRLIDNSTVTYPSPDSDHQFRKLFMAIDNVHEPFELVCPPEAVIPQMELVEAVDKMVPVPRSFSKDQIVNTGERVFVSKLDDIFLSSYRDFKMPKIFSSAK